MKVVLETERLLLRHFTENDADALFLMESEPDVLRYVARKPLADVDAFRPVVADDTNGNKIRPLRFGSLRSISAHAILTPPAEDHVRVEAIAARNLGDRRSRRRGQFDNPAFFLHRPGPSGRPPLLHRRFLRRCGD